LQIEGVQSQLLQLWVVERDCSGVVRNDFAESIRRRAQHAGQIQVCDDCIVDVEQQLEVGARRYLLDLNIDAAGVL
jgi:hypothetical protein